MSAQKPVSGTAAPSWAVAVVLVVVVAIAGYLAYRTFAPPPDPTAGLTVQQQVQQMQEAARDYQRRQALHPTHRGRGLLGAPRPR